MEEILLLVENHGLGLVGFIGVSYALYKILMYVLAQKADEFEQSHTDLKELMAKDLERLNRIETILTDHIGDQKVFRQVIVDLIKGNK